MDMRAGRDGKRELGNFICFFFVNHKAANIGSHEKPVLSVATYGPYVYSASEDSTIRTWDRRMPGNVCDKKRVSLVCFLLKRK